VPHGALVRTGHALWFRGIVPRIGALLSDGDAYRYLPASTAYLPDGATLTAMLRAAGFADVDRRELMLGAVQLLSGTRTVA
jgi:demethylmenaquinone methyltransferase/2-methoxy-6-polyprenyl-1,4-benzoquinol methylase